MKKRNEFLLILTAFIWGVAFVAQTTGGDAIGPMSFNGARFLIGGLVLIPAIALLDRMGLCHVPETKEEKKTLVTGGVTCGLALCIASNFQQMGLTLGTEAGKAGFLTACYILIVPLLGLFLKKKCGWNVWVGVVLTVAGLYLLCMEGSFFLRLSDILVLICAFCYAFHIMVVDRFSPLVDGVRMSCIQFFVAGGLGLVLSVIFEMKPFSGGFGSWAAAFTESSAWIALLYAGICSSGIAYTLQIVGQQGVDPTVASLLMSLESVFSVLAGWVLLHQVLSGRALIGCALIFCAVVLAQIPVGKKKTV